MADVTIGAKLTADSSEAVKSVRDFKTELKQAQAEVVTLSEKFGATSKEAAAAAQKAAGLKDAIGDARSLVDAFNPDTKFRAFGASINTVVGGFTALQGVLALTGVESDQVQKSLVKVQAALALSQGISQLQEGVQTFKNLGSVIQQTTIFQKANAAATAVTSTVMKAFGVNVATTSTAFNVLKGAIAATGIGLLVIGLSAAADAFGLFTSETEKAKDAQAELDEQLKNVNTSLDRQVSFLDREQKLAVARAKAAGKSEAEIFAIEQDFRTKNLKAKEDAYYATSKLQDFTDFKALESLKNQHAEIELAEFAFTEKQREAARVAREKAAKDAEEARKRQRAELEADLVSRQKNFAANPNGPTIQLPKTPEQIAIENNLAAARASYNEMRTLREGDLVNGTQYTNDYIANLEAQKANEQAQYDNRKTLLTSTGGLFQALGAIVGQQTAAGKVLGIAQATINTFIGATEVLRAKSTLPEPLATINKILNFGAVVATGIGAVKNIAKVNVPGGGGGGVSVPTVPAPLTPEKPQQTTTSLDQNSLNALGAATSRAFVVEADIDNNRERIARLNRAARIG